MVNSVELCCTHVDSEMFMRIFSAIVAIATCTLSSDPGDLDGTSQGRQRSTGHLHRRERAAILRTVALQHPDWKVSRIAPLVASQLEAAGIPPVTNKYIAEQMRRFRGGSRLGATPRMAPEHRAFLTAQFEEDHKQTAREVLVQFERNFGASSRRRAHQVTAWWYNALRALYYTPVNQSAVTSTPIPSDEDMWDLGAELDRLLASDDVPIQPTSP